MDTPNYRALFTMIGNATEGFPFADQIGHDMYEITTDPNDESVTIHVDGYRFRTSIVPDTGMGKSYFWGNDLDEDITDHISDVRDRLIAWAERMYANQTTT